MWCGLPHHKQLNAFYNAVGVSVRTARHAHLQLAEGAGIVGDIALVIIIYKGRQVRWRRVAGCVELCISQHAEVGTVQHPLRLHVLPRQEPVPLRWPVYHLRSQEYFFQG